MTIKITREELYEAIWDRPVRKVAAELHISDVALGKICRKHDIPVPGRGYWARISAGQTLTRRRLPLRAEPRPMIIHIEGRQREQQRSGEIVIKLRQLTEDDVVLQDLPMSPFAERLQKRLLKRRADGVGLLNVTDAAQFHVCIAADNVDRVVQIIDRLCQLAEASGLRVKSTDRGAGLEIDGKFVSVQITEVLKKIPHALSEKELRQKERWDRKVQQLQKMGQYIPTWEEPKIPEWDYVPSGRLEVRIDDGTHYDGLRRKFADGQRQKVEWLLPKVIAGAVTCAAAADARKKERARREEERRLAAIRYEERKRIETREKKREELLEKVKADWLAAKSIDTFVQEFYRHKGPRDLPKSVETFVEWAVKRAEALRNRSSIERIEETIDRLDLMNDEVSLNGWDSI